MDAHELSEWAVFDSIEPIGDERADILSASTGIIASGGKLNGGVVPKWDDWVDAEIHLVRNNEANSALFIAALFQACRVNTGLDAEEAPPCDP